MKSKTSEGTFSLIGVFLIAGLMFPALLIVAGVLALIAAGLTISGAFAPDEGGIGEMEISEEEL